MASTTYRPRSLLQPRSRTGIEIRANHRWYCLLSGRADDFEVGLAY